MKLWNDYCIVGAEFEILAEVFAFGDIFVINAVNLILTSLVPQEDNFLFRGPLGKTAGQGKGLQDREIFG